MKNISFIFIWIIIGFCILIFWYKEFQNIKNEIYIQNTTALIVNQLQKTNKLTTTKMTVTKIIEAKKDFTEIIPGFDLDVQLRKILFNDRLLMTVEGIVNAWIDFSKINTWDVIISKEDTNLVVSIRLPSSEIFDVYLTENTKPFERTLGILSKWDINLETKMRNTAINSIKQEVLSWDILKIATENAQVSIRELINKLNKSIVVKYI